ncbi:hypothetical protein K7711_00240 [Nocardia sp. CA2R105]|uniref:DUF6542 domain-containing protein n=1 Tax=Nocardia coffeae TaxID=2873381 RepID=UPI001CA6608F|nr:DUF6542 domain-containing protein [Nocardia coffeae]MBY8854899.1 hypothetical protein [Nocardia coffeae]
MAATQRDRSEVPAPHRSIIPSVPGIPAGAAVLIAVACTLIGFFIDASGGSRDLTRVFAGAYIVGCVLAALAVRYRGLFTTMVTPPLLLFIAVPVAYGQLLDHTSSSMKDILLNQGIPLVNRFPVMAIATVLVLAVGLGRMVLQRRLEEAKPRARGDRQRKGDSWGARAEASRSRRSRGTRSSDTLRSRARAQSATDEKAATKPTRGSRKTTGRVAERPPRVSAPQGSRTAERAKVAATARQRPEADTPSRHRADADAPPRQRPAEPGRQRSAEPQPRRRAAADAPAQPPRQRGAAPSTGQQPRRRAQEPRQRSAEPQPQRRARGADHGDVPPHPRPNVRYRERDSGRIEH